MYERVTTKYAGFVNNIMDLKLMNLNSSFRSKHQFEFDQKSHLTMAPKTCLSAAGSEISEEWLKISIKSKN